MAVDMQTLQSLANVTSINQLKIGDDNQLQRRSGIGAFFRMVGDAFLKLSHAGRAAIAQRNESISNAIRTAVNAARADTRPEITDIRKELNEVTTRIRAAVSSSKQAVLADTLKELHGDERYKALPEASKNALDGALKEIASKRSLADWQNSMDAIKTNFFQPKPDSYDMDEGVRQFKDSLAQSFLEPSQQELVSEGGIHESFTLDTARRNIKKFGNEDVPLAKRAGEENEPGSLSKEELSAHCEKKLREMVGEEHKDLLPFISMMTSQAGMDCASAFLPHLSGLSDPVDGHLTNVGIMPLRNPHSIIVERQGDDLLIHSRFRQDFSTMEGMQQPDSPTVLSYEGRITMRINLSAPPTEHTITVTGANGQPEQRTAFLPQFSFENADASYTTDQPESVSF